MIEHIAMVYAAGGLSANEKHLLGAYCNHTDGHGYCWPSVPRLMDETGMSERTVQRTNALLREKGLIKSVHRVNPRTGLQISNLTRVNLPLLASMRRPERDYGDNIIEEITFEDETFPQVSQGCQSGTPRGANLAPPPRQSGTPRGANLAPKTSYESSAEPPPSSPPSHTGPASAGAGAENAPAARGEGEGSPEETRSAPAGSVPSPRAAADRDEGQAADRDEGQAADRDERLAAARQLLEALPTPIRPGGRTVRALAPAVAAALAAGWTPETLTARMTADLPATVRSARALLTHRLDDLPPPPLAEEPRPALPPHCGNDRCRGGWLEDETGLPMGRCESWPHQIGPALRL